MIFTEKNHTFVICAYKTSEYLGQCIDSLEAQNIRSNILMVTSTPNEHCNYLSKKHHIPLYINTGVHGISGDWNFGYDTATTELVTIAHQDDVYDPEYTKRMLDYLNKSIDPIIYFCHYKELRNGEFIKNNRLINIKRNMLILLKNKDFWTNKWIRRRILSLGNAICCPSVTYVKASIGKTPFSNKYLSNVDWQLWEMLSCKSGSFVYCDEQLMSHRVHSESTTSEIIKDNSRTKEDYDMYLKFWPKFVANIIIKLYSKGQDSNQI